MVEISNIKVYDLNESIIACRNAMRLQPSDYFEDPGCATWTGKTADQIEDWNKSLERAIKLAQSPSNSGHANFLTGIVVNFDIKYPNYISPEMQRYHFFQIVTSSSKMHTLTKMADDPSRYNKYVTQKSLDQMKELQDSFNMACETGSIDDQYEAFMRLVSNCPQGIELFMRVSTNYMQLRNIYAQRKNHKLKEDWGAFCKMIESLPYAKEFLLGNQN